MSSELINYSGDYPYEDRKSSLVTSSQTSLIEFNKEFEEVYEKEKVNEEFQKVNEKVKEDIFKKDNPSITKKLLGYFAFTVLMIACLSILITANINLMLGNLNGGEW